MRGKCTAPHPQVFQGRVIGAPVARANIPCEALRAGLQSLKRPPPFPYSLHPAPSCFHLLQWAAGAVSEPKGGERSVVTIVTIYRAPIRCQVLHMSVPVLTIAL